MFTADFRHLAEDLQTFPKAFGPFRADRFPPADEERFRRLERDALIALGFLNAAITMQPSGRPERNWSGFCRARISNRKYSTWVKSDSRPVGRAALAWLGGAGQHFVVDVEGQLQVAQLLGRFAVPRVGIHADVRFDGVGAVLLENGVERLGRPLQRRDAIGVLGFRISLGQIVLGHRRLEPDRLQTRLDFRLGREGWVRLVAIRFPGRRGRRGLQRGQPRQKIFLAKWNFSLGLVQILAGFRQKILLLFLVLARDFAAAMRSTAWRTRKSPRRPSGRPRLRDGAFP